MRWGNLIAPEFCGFSFRSNFFCCSRKTLKWSKQKKNPRLLSNRISSTLLSDTASRKKRLFKLIFMFHVLCRKDFCKINWFLLNPRERKKFFWQWKKRTWGKKPHQFISPSKSVQFNFCFVFVFFLVLLLILCASSREMKIERRTLMAHIQLSRMR